MRIGLSAVRSRHGRCRPRGARGAGQAQPALRASLRLAALRPEGRRRAAGTPWADSAHFALQNEPEPAKKALLRLTTAAGPKFRILFGVFHSTRFPHYINFNLSGIYHIVLYTFSYILSQKHRGFL